MPGSDIIQSLATGMDVLVLLAEAESGLRVKDVAEKAGISSPVAHNILRTLRVKGFVERDSHRPVYHLGPRLYELGGRREDQSSLQRIEDAMVSVLDAFPDATATFSRAINGEIMVVRRINAQGYGTVQRPSGFILGLYNSASGLATLAFCAEDCYLSLQQQHPLLEEGAHIWSPPETLDRCLEQIRIAGYALHPHANEQRLAVAAPVFKGKHHLAGVLGISRTAAKSQPLGDDELAATINQLKAAADKAGA